MSERVLEMWVVRVRIIDPSSGKDMTEFGLPRSVGDWLTSEGGHYETKPEKWYLDYCREEIKEKHYYLRGYIVECYADVVRVWIDSLGCIHPAA